MNGLIKLRNQWRLNMVSNDIANANVKIVVSRDDENVNSSGSSQKVLKGIFDETKKGNAEITKQGKLGLSGLAKGGELLKSLGGGALAGIGAAVAGILGIDYAEGRPLAPNDQTPLDISNAAMEGGYGGEPTVMYAWEKAIIDGEKVVIRTNNKTGEILETLTLQEARDRQILDNKNQIVSSLQTNQSYYDTQLSHLKNDEGYYVLTSDIIKNISNLMLEDEEAQKAIVEARRGIAEALLAQLAKLDAQAAALQEVGTWTQYSSSQSDWGTSYMQDIFNRQNSLANQAQAGNMIDNLVVNGVEMPVWMTNGLFGNPYGGP